MKDGYRIFDTYTHIGEAVHTGRRYTVASLLRDLIGFGIDRSNFIPFLLVNDRRRQHNIIGRACNAHPGRVMIESESESGGTEIGKILTLNRGAEDKRNNLDNAAVEALHV